jgi:hypothetical protein
MHGLIFLSLLNLLGVAKQFQFSFCQLFFNSILKNQSRRDKMVIAEKMTMQHSLKTKSHNGNDVAFEELEMKIFIIE